MRESIFYNVHDVMNILNVGKTKAYNVMAELNAELTEKGFMVVNGKVYGKVTPAKAVAVVEEIKAKEAQA